MRVLKLEVFSEQFSMNLFHSLCQIQNVFPDFISFNPSSECSGESACFLTQNYPKNSTINERNKKPAEISMGSHMRLTDEKALERGYFYGRELSGANREGPPHGGRWVKKQGKTRPKRKPMAGIPLHVVCGMDKGH
jgi:hypothetical protein